MLRENAIAETGSKAFDLGFDVCSHVDGGPIWRVAVCPQYVLPLRRARGVEKRRLRGQNKRTIGNLAACHGCLRCSNLFECAAQVQADRAIALRRPPWHWSRERKIDLERAGAPFESPQSAAIPG